VEKETITYTLGKNSDVFFEFDYRIKNTNLQFLEIRFPGDHILWSATLQGKGIKPRKGKGNLLLFPLVSGDASINLRLTGYVPTNTKWRIWKSFDISSPALPIPSMKSQVRVFFPKDYYLYSQKGNFEKLPEPADQEPLVVSFFQRLFSFFYTEMSPFSVSHLSPRAQKKASIASPMEESERVPRSFETKDDVAGEGKRGRYDRPSKTQALAPPGRLPKKAPEIVGLPSDQYFRKKGILAMNINIPKEGDLLPADKLWGESRLRVRFLSAGWKRTLGIFTALIVIALGFYLTRKGIIAPLGFLITTFVLFTFLPMIILKSLVFIFDGAVLGALMFAAMSFTWAILKKSEKGALVGLVFIGVMVACPFFAFNDALAASDSPFPDIEIYVPYEEKVPFDVGGTHKVFIPTKDYFLLKFMADPPYIPQKAFEYENEYDITGFVAKGNVEGSMVRFTALLDVFVNTDKWALIELPFANVFIAELTLDNEEIPVRTGGGATKKNPSFAGEKVIYEIPTLGFGRHSLAIVFYVEVEAFAGKKTIAFGFPEALCTDFSLTMQDRDVLLKFEEPQDGYYTKKIAEGILTRASLSEKSFVKISWFPKKFIKKTERPLVYADSEINMFMDYEEVLVSQNAKIRVEKSALASLLFHKHPELMIVDIFSDKVKNWHSLNQNGKTMIEVIFKNEITETVELLVRAKMKRTPGTPIPVVFLEPVDAERFRGNLNLYGLDDYRLLVRDIKGLKISDTGKRHWKEFPGFELQKSYSFTGSAFQAEIVNIPLERKIYADIFGQYTFSEDLLTANFLVDLDVKESFLTSLRLRIPAGFRIGAVDASDISDLHLQKNGVLVLPFRHAVRGKVRFRLVLEKELAGFDAAVVEGIELFEIERVKGRLLVLFPKSFEIRESDISQIRPINIKTLSAHLRQVDQGRFGAKYAYQFKEKPFKAQYEVSRKKPLLDLVKVYHARVEDNLVNVNVLSLFQVKNAPVDHFTILAPARIKDSIKIEGEGIKSILKKTDVEGKNVRITVHTLSGIERSYLMGISFNQYLGRDRVFEMPHIVFPQVKNKTQFVSIETATVYRVEAKVSEAMQEIESETIPALPAGVNLNNVLWAYRITDSQDWRYRLELKRLEREKLIRATILREDIKTLIIPQGYALHEITIKANNRVLQFLPLDFPVDAELWSLKVAGEPVAASIAKTPDKKNVKRLLVPLIKSSTGDRNFDIKLLYLTPIDTFGLRGKIKPSMVETGSIPVEKTTWTLYVPENYSYPEAESNMEEVDITVIEADKTLDLAREYEYWTNMAKTVKGKLKQKAVLNRGKVMTDYLRQQSMTRQMQSDLDQRIQEKQTGDRQTLLQKSQSQNIAVLNEALDIIESNKPASKTIERPEKERGKKAISGRKNIMGWQFKTRDFAEQDKVQESITDLLQSEDEKREIQKKRAMKRKPSKAKKRRAVAQEEEEPAPATQGPASLGAGAVQKMEVERIKKPETGKQQPIVVEDGTARSSMEDFRDRSRPAPPPIRKEMVQQQALPVKKSTLLKGLRSMDIPLPEQGLRLSFKKLGGNPTITLPYRKKGILSGLFYLLLLLAVTAGTLRFRKWHFPAERISGYLKDKSLADCYHIFMNSRVVKVIPTFMMIAAVVLGFPWFIMGLGFNTILLLRYLSIKRYKKKDLVPPYNYKIFLKYFISYIILASSVLFIVTLFHALFFISLVVSTLSNCIYCIIYAVFYFFTNRKPTEKIEEDESNHISPPQDEKESGKD